MFACVYSLQNNKKSAQTKKKNQRFHQQIDHEYHKFYTEMMPINGNQCQLKIPEEGEESDYIERKNSSDDDLRYVASDTSSLFPGRGLFDDSDDS